MFLVVFITAHLSPHHHTHLFTTHFNIIFPYKSASRKWSLPFSPPTDIVYAFLHPTVLNILYVICLCNCPSILIFSPLQLGRRLFRQLGLICPFRN